MPRKLSDERGAQLRKLEGRMFKSFPRQLLYGVNMWQTWHCRCGGCRMVHYKGMITFKKRTLEQIYDGTIEYLSKLHLKKRLNDTGYWTNRFTAEEIAAHLQVKTHFVKQVLHKLNLEGIVSQPIHKAPHDSKRDYTWGSGFRKGKCSDFKNPNGDSSWAADIYVYLKG